MRHIKDLREFLRALSDIGELQEIDLEVERDLEIGAIIRRAYDLKAPAPLFNNIKGVARGFRVLGGSAGVSAQKAFTCRELQSRSAFRPKRAQRR